VLEKFLQPTASVTNEAYCPIVFVVRVELVSLFKISPFLVHPKVRLGAAVAVNVVELPTQSNELPPDMLGAGGSEFTTTEVVAVDTIQVVALVTVTEKVPLWLAFAPLMTSCPLLVVEVLPFGNVQV
jgi:hypothetical protein